MKIKKNFIFFGNLKFWMWGKVGDTYSTPHTVSVGWGLSPPRLRRGVISCAYYIMRILLCICTSHTVSPLIN